MSQMRACAVSSEDRRKMLAATSVVLAACVLTSAAKLIARSRLTPEQLISPSRFVLSIECDVILVAVVLVSVIYIEAGALSSIGFRAMSRGDLAAALAILIAGLELHKMMVPAAARLGLGSIAIRMGDTPPLLEWSSIIVAPIAEEMVFRGYLLERLEQLSGRIDVAVAISCVLFGLWHYPLWGVQNVAVSGTWGILAAMLYVWRRNLPACIAMHFLTDAIVTGAISFSIGRMQNSRYLYLEFFLRNFR
jgi:uncharacterized protein